MRTNEELAALVVRHLTDILAGECSIKRADLEKIEDDPSLLEILTGLLFLHEDLQLRQAERARAEAEVQEVVRRLEEKNQELEKSQSVLMALAAELSTPVIKVWDRALMVPVIGNVDSDRAADLMDRLLKAVVHEKANHIILDLTGVSTIDTGTADRFLRIVQAVRLLGAEPIVAGVPPGVSLAMVSLGIDLTGIITVRNVREALLRCMPRT